MKSYVAIDLKSFYASVECVERGLDPLRANLVVADESRTEKTICLAVSPALKARGVPSRPRLFEVVQKVGEINAIRARTAPGQKLCGGSIWDDQLRSDPCLAVEYIAAPPRMALYMAYSARIYGIYTRFVSPEDVHVYSIDEVFIDVTPYLRTYRCTARQLAMRMIRAVLKETGITATAGIGTNLYLCKVAMDIVAKKMPPDRDGVRIAELDEYSYRRQLWTHRPLTDFWRVGRGYARRLEGRGLFTMGDVARCSVDDEDILYDLFGVNAELLIDHAWGWESCTIQDIKAYRPETNSLSSGQVLHCPYPWDKARLVTREMADMLSMDLVKKGLGTDLLDLTVGYDIENVTRAGFSGTVEKDFYGRGMPKAAHGSVRLGEVTSSTREITQRAVALFERIADPALTVRRICLAACRVRREDMGGEAEGQTDLFGQWEEEAARQEARARERERERSRQQAVLRIREKFGKNAIFMGMNLQSGGTMRERNLQIGGHRAG